MQEIHHKAIAKVRGNFKQALLQYPDFNTTWNLLRFCQAGYWNEKVVFKMIKEYLEARKNYNFDKIKALPRSTFNVITENFKI